MKNRTVKAVVGVLVTVLLVGCNSMTAGEQTETKADNTTVITETTDNMKAWDNIDNIIEVIESTVLDNDGNASDAFGIYVEYESGKYKKGDRVRIVIVYNPDSNFPDGILYSVDTLIE